MDLANEKGITPLMRAVRHGPDRATAADLILYGGADPDRKNPRGDAPLHIAIKFGGNVGKGTVVSALLAANADPCVRDAQGYTPYQLSRGAIRQALSEAGGYDRSSPDGPGCPLSGEVAEEDQRAKDIAARREAQRIAREEADRVDKENAAAQQQREYDADNLSDRDHEFIVGVRPIYPRRAQTRGIEGHVIVEYVVTATGAVRNPAVVEAEPPGIFDRAAIQSVLHYKFRPRVVDGEAVEARGVRTRVVFELEDVEEEQAEGAEAAKADTPEQTAPVERKDASPRFLVFAHILPGGKVGIRSKWPYPRAGELYSLELVSGWPFADGDREEYCRAKMSMYGRQLRTANLSYCSAYVLGDAKEWDRLKGQRGPVDVGWLKGKCVAVYAQSSTQGGGSVVGHYADIRRGDSEEELRAYYRTLNRSSPPDERVHILEIRCLGNTAPSAGVPTSRRSSNVATSMQADLMSSPTGPATQ